MPPLKVLLVEDDLGNLQIAALRLQSLGYEVVACEDGPQAQAACREAGGRFDLAVVDVWMPGMSGGELIAWMRGDGGMADTPILVVSAALHAMAIPQADAALAKPYHMKELVQAIDEALARRPVAR